MAKGCIVRYIESFVGFRRVFERDHRLKIGIQATMHWVYSYLKEEW